MPTVTELCERLRVGGVAARVDPPEFVDVSVRGITHDSRQIEPGVMFACLPGDHHDGHDYAAGAVAAGASAIFVQRRLQSDAIGSTPQLMVDDTRRHLGVLAAQIHGNPSRKLRAVGITGTNGKTTTAQMLEAIFEYASVPTGVIGTLHGPHTTPEATDLQRRLADFVDAGCDVAVLEVSSHALALHRVDGTEFDAVVFMNLGHDHLDLHGSQEEYFRSKASLFTPHFAPVAIVNVDDPYGLLLADAIANADGEMRVIPFSVSDAENLILAPDHMTFRWHGVDVKVPIGGVFNVSNAVAALTVAVELGLDPREAAAGLEHLPRVPGRFEVVSHPHDSGATPMVVVDYAHTPDGLEVLLSAARTFVARGGRLITVFGCGGQRDQAKRPEMGAVAAALADFIVLTSDNPREEDPERILDDIQSGIAATADVQLIRHSDRRLAIGVAVDLAHSGDVVVIAGKGHERTQDLGSEVIEFDDRSVAREILENLP